jgi:hypothetical protein
MEIELMIAYRKSQEALLVPIDQIRKLMSVLNQSLEKVAKCLSLAPSLANPVTVAKNLKLVVLIRNQSLVLFLQNPASPVKVGKSPANPVKVV